MGVTGLWRLIEPAGKPVPVESLENKVLAVDISIWLHQVVKGYQDAKGAPLPNAHLMGLFQRLCKLLYFRIKPVFVFDGGFPELKKETIARRQDNKIKYNSESQRLKREIALLLSKKTAIGSLLGKDISPKKNKIAQSQNNQDDLFKLPALPQREDEDESESESDEESNSSASTVDLHSVDLESENFKNMPVKDKYDLLIELKETRKMNSWGKLHTLPKKSDNFSDFQMQRLLKRRKLQECLQDTEKEMGDTGMSMNELESLLNEEGIDTKIENLPTRRIASDNKTRYLLINNVQHAITEAKKKEEAESTNAKVESVTVSTDELEEDMQKAIKMSLDCKEESSKNNEKTIINKTDELEEDLEKAIKMSLECVDEPNTSGCTSKTDDSWTSYKSDSDYSCSGSDSEDGDGYEQPDFSTAKAYIMQYSDLTHKTIDNIVSSTNKGIKNKQKCLKVDEIIDELNKEKSVIVDNIDLSSSEEEDTQKLNVIEPSTSSEVNDHLNDNVNVIESCISSEVDDESDNIKNSEINQLNNSNVYSKDKGDTAKEKIMDESVICIESPCNNVINLDTTTEENTEQVHIENIVSDNQSDSSDGEFEEVSEIEVKSIKPVVQVTLNVNETIEDDIFADVFGKTKSDEDNNTISVAATGTKPKVDMVETLIEPITTINNHEHQTPINNKRIHSKQEETMDNTTVEITNAKSHHDKDKTNSVEQIEQIQIPVSKDIQSDKPAKKAISTDTLNSMVAEIENQEDNLLQEKGRLERIGRNITEQMTKEAQELLQVFGIPYIVAPMEAEAQCAFLESVNLTDGTITDDSDIWLFGGKTVYKNFFNQKKHVLQFLSERIEKSFNLSREQLILLALLVGSDYTTGVTGVGPVTALEILASFPFNKRQLLKEQSKLEQYQQIVTGLKEFKTWVRAGRRTDNISLKKKLRNVTLGEDFPSVRVVQAYLEPNVEKSEEKFTWGEIDITVLREYAKAKFGWSQNKLDVIVQPVLKRIMERKTQKTVQDYFKRKIEFQSLEDQMSKRVKAAVQKMDLGNSNTDENLLKEQESEDGKVKAGQKRKGRGKNSTLDPTAPESSKIKRKKLDETDKVCTTSEEGLQINIPKTNRYQEIIPQREKVMQNILQNKMKAIEIFRKSKIDRKRKPVKRRPNLPKDKADLSESSDSS